MFSVLPKNWKYLRKRISENGMGSGRNYLKRGISFLKRNGVAKTVDKAYERLCRDADEAGYTPVKADEETLSRQRSHVFDNPYRFSILVPVYETEPELLRKMLCSVGDQTYGNWELILADASSDDSRRNIVREFTEEYNLLCKDSYGSIHEKVVYVRVPENKGISGNTNEALSRATGDYTGLLDHDDVLENTALFDIMSAIDENEKYGRADESIRRVMAVYTDEDKISEDGTRYFDHHEKPSFDPVLLCTNNYICHFFVVDTNIAKSVGGFRPQYDGAQDHDFILRCTEGMKREQILHVPKVLYHWRSTKGSTSENPDAKLYAYEAGKRAVEDHLKREGITAKVSDSAHLGFFEIKYDSLEGKVETISTEELGKTVNAPSDLPGKEFLMVLSKSLAPVSDGIISDMMSVMSLTNVGAVTGKIVGRNGKIESAGYDINGQNEKIPRFSGLNRRFSGYMHRAELDRLSDAFSPDCVLLRVDAVESLWPETVLKEGFDIYYLHRAVFTRKTV